jgi:hypothetical protein
MVVVNRHQSNDVISHADAEKLLGRPIFHAIPNDSRTSALAISQTTSVIGADPNSVIAKSYLALAAKLAASVGGATDGAPAAADRGYLAPGPSLSFGEEVTWPCRSATACSAARSRTSRRRPPPRIRACRAATAGDGDGTGGGSSGR